MLKSSFMKGCRFSLLVLIPLILTGCGFNSRYSPSHIRSEYARNSDAPLKPGGAARGDTGRPFAAAISTSPAAETRDETDNPLTLDRAIDMALVNNPDLQQAVHRWARVRAMKALADTAFWPMVGVYAEYLQGNAPSAFLFKTIDQRQLPANINFNDPGWFENYESGVNARMNLFNGGKDYLSLRMAEQDLEISARDRQVIINDLKAQVIAAFFDVLAAERFVDIARQSILTVSEQLRIIRIQYEGGGALKSDVLTLKVHLAQAEEALVESEKRRNLAKAVLAHLLGLDPAVDAPHLEPDAREDTAGFDIPETCEEGIVYALAHRPELAKVRNLLVKSRMGVDIARSGYLPRIDLMAKYYVDDPGLDYDRDRENWTTAILFNWDLFSGFSTRARVSQAEALLKEMLAADREATMGVKLDVKKTYLDLQAARARYEVAASSVTSAEESFRLVKEYYNGGTVTITRYLAAELDRSRARMQSTAAFYDKIKAHAEFARAIGMLTDGNPKNDEKTVTDP